MSIRKGTRVVVRSGNISWEGKVVSARQDGGVVVKIDGHRYGDWFPRNMVSRRIENDLDRARRHLAKTR